MKTTTTYGFGEPETSDSPNGPIQIGDLSGDLEVVKWLSRSLKPTVEEKKQSSNLTLTESFVLLPGLKYEVTPAVASKLIVDFTVVPQPGSAASFIRWDVYKNGTAFLGSGTELFYQLPTGATAAGYVPIHHTVVLSLAAEPNTIEIRARQEGGSGVMNKRVAGMVTQLFAS